MRKVFVLLAAVALVGGACKSGDKKATTSDTKASTSTGLRAALLTAAELPPGFRRTSVDIDKRTTSPLGCAQLDQVDEQYVKTTEHTAEAAFQNGDDQTATQFLDETIYTFKTDAEAKQYFDGEVAGFNACKTFSTTDADGTQNSGSIQTYAFPAVGDQSIGVSMVVTSVSNGQTQTLAGPAVIVRKGRTFMGFIAFHAGNQPGLSVADIEAIVRKATDKL